MHHWIGGGLMLVGAGGAMLAWIVNTNLPVHLGPVPFVGPCAVAFVGLLVWSW